MRAFYKRQPSLSYIFFNLSCIFAFLHVVYFHECSCLPRAVTPPRPAYTELQQDLVRRRVTSPVLSRIARQLIQSPAQLQVGEAAISSIITPLCPPLILIDWRPLGWKYSPWVVVTVSTDFARHPPLTTPDRDALFQISSTFRSS